jgi:hypothetical protein
VAYVGSESYHQSVAVDHNAAVKMSSGSYNSAAGGYYARPYTAFNQILENKSNATSNYNSLQVSFDRHMAHGLQVQSSLTWSKTIDEASTSNVTFGSPYLGNPFNMKWNRGNSTMDVHWNWVTKFIYPAFTNNAAGTFGNSSKNILFGPREFGADAAIMKSWALVHDMKLQFRWEAFNVTNYPRFANPSADYGNTVDWGNFGKIGDVGNIAPRVMQGALKLIF